TGFGYPERNIVHYTFEGTAYTTPVFEWVWYDGVEGPADSPELKLPLGVSLPDQGAIFIGENGKRLLLPHFMQLPRLLVDNSIAEYDIKQFDPEGSLGQPIRDYGKESPLHYHEFINACLGKASCSAPFTYAAQLTETILLGVIAGRFPGKTLHYDKEQSAFTETEANIYLSGAYRNF
ncbi:MAG: gfo/Idh/MocA family oxidoreductase, partial [Bacteroidota bacterium]